MKFNIDSIYVMKIDMRTIPILIGLLVALTAPHEAAAQAWTFKEPKASGWRADTLSALSTELHDEAVTAFLVIQDGSIVAAWGDTARKVNVASIRKSLLSALYGRLITDGKLSLTRTLAELGIDDDEPALNPAEKRATLRDLLMSRSGIYHAAAYETGDMRRKRPVRGSHDPGTFWYYNNWDFNALGTIYREAAGETIFDGFAKRIAIPIGMEDFSASDGRYVGAPMSRHPAYRFDLTARDLARFGQLILDGGRWNDRPIISASWIEDSTSLHSDTDHHALGYGYLWWILPVDRFGPGAALASGYGGQKLAIVPAKHLVVVQLIEKRDGPHRDRTGDFLDRLSRLMAAAP
ncbi:beta-lactamase family protein [Methylobacterium sp. J-072]|uniref:serine hydrolase domain-containing protein n=1 Tax=Methylobacterium sp. J-072 TaxID=2836651 RepID=UPI001FBB0491|nr:serine hydrolase [Methylobacterium sp. J-072]MCJ2096699.1 beta-lactamase family protein [Methylobacterium sp. J-072]